MRVGRHDPNVNQGITLIDNSVDPGGFKRLLDIVDAGKIAFRKSEQSLRMNDVGDIREDTAIRCGHIVFQEFQYLRLSDVHTPYLSIAPQRELAPSQPVNSVAEPRGSFFIESDGRACGHWPLGPQ
jgi:hypothetical protein